MTFKLIPNLQEQIVSQLRVRILSGQLTPGTPFREQSLAAEFGISRGPIRDALLTLTMEGLVHSKAHVGARVAAEPSDFKRAVIVRVRREIEAAALADWFDRPDQQLLVQLETNLAQYQRACTDNDLARVLEFDLAFHRVLVESVDGGSLGKLWLPVMLQMNVRTPRCEPPQDRYDEHAAIFAAIQSGARARAIELLQRHIR